MGDSAARPLTGQCWGGEDHRPTTSISYGDGKQRTMCSRCFTVLAGDPVPPPDIAALDMGDDE